MSASDLLESQHREVEKLFKQIEKTSSGEKKIGLFEEIADKLAIHAAIEEHHFYPAVKEKRTEDILLESVEEHLTIKRTLADLLKMDVGDEHFDAKITVLKEEVQHHVGEEEKNLFPTLTLRSRLVRTRNEEIGARFAPIRTPSLPTFGNSLN